MWNIVIQLIAQKCGLKIALQGKRDSPCSFIGKLVEGQCKLINAIPWACQDIAYKRLQRKIGNSEGLKRYSL